MPERAEPVDALESETPDTPEPEPLDATKPAQPADPEHDHYADPEHDPNLVSRVRESVRSDGLIRPGEMIVVLLSGGRDSTCLLDVCACLAGAGMVRALHVNYGLRAEADLDQQACVELCERLGVELSVVQATPRPNGVNLQAWARELRYRAAAERAGGAQIATGHTATDQVETILYRLASSPSRRALLGMRPREGQIVRPLLALTRADTTAYCRARGLGWRDDATNDSAKYARNRIRRDLLADLRTIHPAAEANILAVAELLRDEHDLLDRLVNAELQGAESIALARLAALEPALARLVVQRLADSAIGGPAPGTTRRLADLLAMPTKGVARLDLPHGVRATAIQGQLSFSRTPAIAPRAEPRSRVEPTPRTEPTLRTEPTPRNR